jgi:uncharacterized protein YcbX
MLPDEFQSAQHMADCVVTHADAPMTTVEELHIYPVKGCRGIARQSVRLVTTGFEWDRHWMIVDATGNFVTQRTHPQLARIQPEIDDDYLTLHAENFAPLKVSLLPFGDPSTVMVWRDECTALDQGDEASNWLSEAIKDSVRLVRVAAPSERMANPKFAGKDPVPVSFTDGFPILICNRSSLDDLNQRMPEPVPMSRFRPNLVVSDLPAFAEDRIAAFRIGAVTLKLVKPCTRCVVTSTDQQTGERATNPLPVLRKFRFDKALLGVTFGENAIIAAGIGHTIERGAACAARLDEPAPKFCE